MWIQWFQNLDPVNPKCGSHGAIIWIQIVDLVDPVDPECGSRVSKMWIPLIQMWILWIHNMDLVDPKCVYYGSNMWILNVVPLYPFKGRGVYCPPLGLSGTQSSLQGNTYFTV